MPFDALFGDVPDDQPDQFSEGRTESPEQAQAVAHQQHEQRNRKLAALEARLMQVPVVPSPSPTRFDWENDPLPDPVEQPTEFAKNLTDRVTAKVATTMTAGAQQSAAQQEIVRHQHQNNEALWATFAEEYPDLADHRMVVASVLEHQFGNRVQGTLSDTFDKVAGATREYIGRIRGQENPAPSTFVPSRTGRTAGLGAGVSSGLSPFQQGPGRQASREPGPVTLTQQIKDLRLKSGLV